MLGAVFGRSGLRLLAGRSAEMRGSVVPVLQSLVSRRWQCSKPEGEKAKPEGQSFKIPGHRPTNFEKKILVWGGRFKNESDIPELVSYETVDSAKSKVRVKFSVLMMLLTVVGCVVMVVSGKQAARQQESLAKQNLDKKARLKTDPEK
ncbi:protein FAM162A [Rhinoderma darwinii]|uniref:protein FAM162A n=1 Tax=Rhinoderma darwinii TaxID=43563 RepID=UPI003F66B333